MNIRVRVQPRAKKNCLGGQMAGPNQEMEWKLSITAPAQDGKANDACMEFLARGLGIARSRVRIVSGQKSRHKIIAIEGVSKAEFQRFAAAGMN